VARVELTDAPTYTGSKHGTILRSMSWSNTQISAEIPPAGMDFSGTAYLYVTDSSGNVNANGNAVGTVGTSASGGSSVTQPDPPSNVTVQ